MSVRSGRRLRAAICLVLVCAMLTRVSSFAANPAEGATVVRTPSTGESYTSSGGATIDYSNVSEGYVMVRYSGAATRVKVQITKTGSNTYTYNLNTSGVYETFPLTCGDGNYTINVFENVYANQYAMLMGITVNVALKNEMLPFLYPSQYVNFTAESATVKKGAELAEGVTDQLAVVSNVYNYVITQISYDTVKAAGVKGGYLPNVDDIVATGKGICFDYAAVMAAMLRSRNIPTKLQVGYVCGGLYHAWISVWTNKTGWVNNAIYFDGVSWKLMDPTFASEGNQSGDIMRFIGDGRNYSAVYVY